MNVEGVRALIRAAAGRIGRWVQLSSAASARRGRPDFGGRPSGAARHLRTDQSGRRGAGRGSRTPGTRRVYAVLRPYRVRRRDAEPVDRADRCAWSGGGCSSTLAATGRRPIHVHVANARMPWSLRGDVRRSRGHIDNLWIGAPWKTSPGQSLTRSAVRVRTCASPSGRSAARCGWSTRLRPAAHRVASGRVGEQSPGPDSADSIRSAILACGSDSCRPRRDGGDGSCGMKRKACIVVACEMTIRTFLVRQLKAMQR